MRGEGIVATLVSAVGLAATGCGSAVVEHNTASETTIAGLEGKTQIATMRTNDVVVTDAHGNHVDGWQRTSFFSPLRVQISPLGGEIGFGVRPDQFDPDYVAIAGPVGEPTVIPEATVTGDVLPLGGGAVAWLERGTIRITDRNGVGLTGDGMASTQSLQLVAARDGKAVYSAGGAFGSDVIQRVDRVTGDVRELGTTEVYGHFDVNRAGEAVGVVGQELLIIDDAGVATPLCAFADRRPQSPKWSPDGTRVVAAAASDIEPSLDIFVCERGANTPMAITDDEAGDRHPVFDATGARIIWTREGDLVVAPAAEEAAPEVLISGSFSDWLDVAWLE